MHEILVALADFARVENGVYSRGRVGIISEVKRNGGSVKMELGRIVVGLEKRNMEDGVETGQVCRETKLVRRVRDCVIDGERAKTAVVKLVGGTSRLDVATQQPDELVRNVLGSLADAVIVVASLMFLSLFELIAELVVESFEPGGEIGPREVFIKLIGNELGGGYL